MRIESHDDPEVAGQLVATWRPQPHHAAFEGVLNGGVIGTLLDCHLNWTAAMHLMRERSLPGPPGCVTAEYTVRLRRPTPTDRPVQLRARVVEAAGDRVTVEGELESGGVVTATARGSFVAVGPDHPAFERW
jgi:acyl-coenzyme A thioesterase PaaI-like protein